MAFNREIVEKLAFPPVTRTLQAQDCMLYALSLGLGRDPNDRNERPFVYEAALRVLPTQAAVTCTPGHWVADPALGIDAGTVLHGEQAIRFHCPIPVGTRLTGRSRISNVWDKGEGKGALVEVECRVTDADDTPIWTVNRTAYLRGEGGFGGPVQVQAAPWIRPDRAPDAVCNAATRGVMEFNPEALQ